MVGHHDNRTSLDSDRIPWTTDALALMSASLDCNRML
jgi:hypothetical protein